MKHKNRIRFDELNREHINHYMSLSKDMELVANMGWKPFESHEEKLFRQTIEVLSVPYCIKSEAITFSIMDTIGNKPIGFVSIKGINKVKSFAEIGIAIVEKEYRDRGYGTEALEMIIDYAFNKLNLTLLGLTVFPFNERAIAVYEKVGFHKKKILKNSWLLPNGEYSDMWLMEITRD